jgi:hypothetical protein
MFYTLDLIDPLRRESFISTLLETYSPVVDEFGDVTNNNDNHQSEQLLNRTAEHVLKHLRDVSYPAFLDSQVFDAYLAQLNGDVWAKPVIKNEPNKKASNKTEHYEREQINLFIRQTNQKMNESARVRF